MAETLSLDLSTAEASSLFLLLGIADSDLRKKQLVLEDLIKNYDEFVKRSKDPPSKEDLQGTLDLNISLMAEAQVFSKRVGEIILELDTTKTESKIIKPNWHGKEEG